MNNQIQEDGTFLTIRDVANLIKCSDRHVTTLRKNGKIPQPVKLGASVRWPSRVIQDWIDAGCPPSAS
jgi:predicted DNA-binding transcriptional regulator AlpA